MTKKLTLPETAEYLKTHDDFLILTHRGSGRPAQEPA